MPAAAHPMRITLPDSSIEFHCDDLDVAIVLRGRTRLREAQ